MKTPLRTLLLTLCLMASAPAVEPALLFNGNDLSGWQEPHGAWSVVKAVQPDPGKPSAFTATPGSGVLLNTTAAPTVDLLSVLQHGDCELHAEFCIPAGSNSGIYLQGRYEVQIFDSFGKAAVTSADCGGIYEGRDNGKGFPGRAPRLNAAKAPGEWQSFDIRFRAPRFDADGKKTENARFLKVTWNGQVIHENVEVTNPTRSAAFADEKPLGPLKLQGDHGPVAFRNLQLKPLPPEP